MTDLAEIWVPEPQNNSKNNGTNVTRGHMGQIPVIRCFVQKFYMVAYVTKAGFKCVSPNCTVAPLDWATERGTQEVQNPSSQIYSVGKVD